MWRLTFLSYIRIGDQRKQGLWNWDIFGRWYVYIANTFKWRKKIVSATFLNKTARKLRPHLHKVGRDSPWRLAFPTELFAIWELQNTNFMQLRIEDLRILRLLNWEKGRSGGKDSENTNWTWGSVTYSCCRSSSCYTELSQTAAVAAWTSWEPFQLGQGTAAAAAAIRGSIDFFSGTGTKSADARDRKSVI